jgi:DhnA family fructose-bisphosphate aldolase class Ia
LVGHVDHPTGARGVTNPRLARMFNASGRCLDVAIDHGMVNEPDLLIGIENMRTAVAQTVGAGPDVIQLTPGMTRLLNDARGHVRPALAVRADVSNVYGHTLPSHPFTQITPGIVDIAVMADAVCVVVNLMMLPGAPDLHRQSVQNILSVKRQCQAVGMPLMVEPLVMAANEHGGYMVDGDLALIKGLVRQAAELGADVIKADPCSNPADFHQVVEVASGIPVLVRGGGREADEIILERTSAIIAQGAAGIVYGRNIIQHNNPAGMVKALMGIVHESLDPATAALLLARQPVPTGSWQ